MSSELWFREFERLYNEKLDAGVPEKKAYDAAGDEANGALIDRLGDMADEARMRRKEQAADASVSASAEGGSHSPNSPAVLASKGA